MPRAAPALFSETAAAAAFAVEDAGASADAEAGGAIATDVLDALVEWLQPDHPASRQLAVAIAAVCGGPAMVLAPMARPHAETRALAIRLLAALLPRSHAPTEARPGAAGAPGAGAAPGGGRRAGLPPAAPAGNLDRLTAAPGAFVPPYRPRCPPTRERAAGREPRAAARRRRRRRLSRVPAAPGLFPAVAAAPPYPLTHGVRAAL